jgi:hypothetical protein
LIFSAEPSQQLVAWDGPVVLVLSLHNQTEGSMLVKHPANNQLVEIHVTGPDGKELYWQSTGVNDSKRHPAAEWVVLEQYRELSVKRTISLEDGEGFAFEKPGQYWVTAEYSLDSSDVVPPSGNARLMSGRFHSSKVAFCIEVCTPREMDAESDAGLSQTAAETVRVFYNNILRYRPLGLPTGAARTALWPLLSNRLMRELEDLEACDDDYYRRYGAMLKRNHDKPGTPWLEDGLFSGPDEEANPAKFTILGSRAIGGNRFEVHVKFTFEQTEDCGEGRPCEHFDFEGLATVAEESGQFVIDDFTSLDHNYDLRRLSDGFEQCRDGKWVGTP